MHADLLKRTAVAKHCATCALYTLADLCAAAALSLSCRDVKASNVLVDDDGSVVMTDFGSSYCFDVHTGLGYDPYAVAEPSGSSAAGMASSSELSSKQHRLFKGPKTEGMAGTDLYMAPSIGNLVASNVYDAHVDCYASVVLATSLLCGGYAALRSVAEPWPAGVSRQRHSVKDWLRRIADGMEPMTVSAKLRHFVDQGISSLCTVEHLLAHPWLSGAKLRG
jgi:serine/threonine protein kinase